MCLFNVRLVSNFSIDMVLFVVGIILEIDSGISQIVGSFPPHKPAMVNNLLLVSQQMRADLRQIHYIQRCLRFQVICL